MGRIFHCKTAISTCWLSRHVIYRCFSVVIHLLVSYLSDVKSKILLFCNNIFSVDCSKEDAFRRSFSLDGAKRLSTGLAFAGIGKKNVLDTRQEISPESDMPEQLFNPELQPYMTDEMAFPARGKQLLPIAGEAESQLPKGYLRKRLNAGLTYAGVGKRFQKRPQFSNSVLYTGLGKRSVLAALRNSQKRLFGGKENMSNL